jgi:hypothetical protein
MSEIIQRLFSALAAYHATVAAKLDIDIYITNYIYFRVNNMAAKLLQEIKNQSRDEVRQLMSTYETFVEQYVSSRQIMITQGMHTLSDDEVHYFEIYGTFLQELKEYDKSEKRTAEDPREDGSLKRNKFKDFEEDMRKALNEINDEPAEPESQRGKRPRLADHADLWHAIDRLATHIERFVSNTQ